MQQIVLNTNLKFLIKQLSFENKGKLFAALLEENGDDLTDEAGDIYRYILSLQEENAKKKRKMKDLSALAVAAKKRMISDLLDNGQPSVTDGAPAVPKRKVTKENNLNNKIKKIFISSANLKTEEMKEQPIVPFSPPSVAEVRAFVENYELNVIPEEFVDFYTSHGWCAGKTPIKNWQATARLWHRRSSSATGNDSLLSSSPYTLPPQGGGEAKSEHSQGMTGNARGNPLTTAVRSRDDSVKTAHEEGYVYCGGEPELCLPKETEPPTESPFARFMRRIEYDIASEENK